MHYLSRDYITIFEKLYSLSLSLEVICTISRDPVEREDSIVQICILTNYETIETIVTVSANTERTSRYLSSF